MPIYLIHRMKDAPRENFRWAAHTSGLAIVKQKDYEADGQVEAATPYIAWKRLLEEGRGLHPGDLLEGPNQELKIAKYIGFEPAQWFFPEMGPPSPHEAYRTSGIPSTTANPFTL